MQIKDNEELVILIARVEEAKKVDWIYASKIKGSEYDEITEALEKVTG